MGRESLGHDCSWERRHAGAGVAAEMLKQAGIVGPANA
jgi:hypothetical protein